jgi:phenylpropionate dioxygenase-like ring-hydroxylating dioxygenase large terminal subunit
MQLETRLLHDYWHLACHRRELPADGDFIRLAAFGGEIVVFNDGGDLVAFDNKCPHRGARLYDASHGTQPATCRYHGWSYRDGHVIIPERQKFSGCDLGTASLRHYRTEWCGDFLFVGVQPREPLAEQLDETAQVLEEISFNIDRRFDFNAYDYECHWGHALENALEPYHIASVHGETLATLQLEAGQNCYYGRNSIWRAPLGNSRLHKQLSRLRSLFNLDYQYEGYMSIYVFPFTLISSTFGYSYSLQHFLPAPNDLRTTRFSSRLLTAPAAPQAAGMLQSFFESTVAMNHRVFDEDHAICKRMAPEDWTAAPLQYWSEEEEKIQHFRRSCLDAQPAATAL